MPYFPIGGIPPRPPFRPPAEATLSDLPAGRQAGWTILSFSLAANYYVKKDED